MINELPEPLGLPDLPILSKRLREDDDIPLPCLTKMPSLAAPPKQFSFPRDQLEPVGLLGTNKLALGKGIGFDLISLGQDN